ncbi:Aldo/keto reductase [Armillaria solidipes]|uniref:Aldo/keto reductase n=1 Tax=Armillaria solidipes TaxID=1076256 RepID=A0A2H3B432_9AGAR|nr:Aldo/keto reductase [Armillaria solidipes]
MSSSIQYGDSSHLCLFLGHHSSLRLYQEWAKWLLGKEEGITHIKAAYIVSSSMHISLISLRYDAGINTFDTVNVYSNGSSEIILEEAIKKYDFPRDKIVILTKVYGVVGKEPKLNLFGDPKPDALGYVNQHGLSHKMKALHDVVQASYVRYIGMSSCHVYQFHAMQNYAIQNNLTPFISMQNHYNLIYREEEREMFPTLKSLNMFQMFGAGAIPWSPLGRGKLTRTLVKQGMGSSHTKNMGQLNEHTTRRHLLLQTYHEMMNNACTTKARAEDGDGCIDPR